ncbi:MAG: hypothetical protein ABSD29_00030 [Verrucomicrobiota bacterium]|jgi:hypothetical protein
MNKETTTPGATNAQAQGAQPVVKQAVAAQPVAAPAQPKKEFVRVPAPKNMTLIEAANANDERPVIKATTPNTKKD